MTINVKGLLRVLEKSSVLAMLEKYSPIEPRLASLIAEVVVPEFVPERSQVTVMPREAMRDIYFGRRITAGDAGIEVVGIDSFIDALDLYRGEIIGAFRIANSRGWVLCVLDQEWSKVLACVGQFNEDDRKLPIAFYAPDLRRSPDEEG